MRRIPLRRLSSFLFPKPLRIFNEIYSNSLMAAWSRKHPAERILGTREELYGHLNARVIGNTPIDYLEFGVFQGASIREWAEINAHPESGFVGFDTFEGLPEDWSGFRTQQDRGTFDVEGSVPQTSDPRIRFVKGLFQETLVQFLDSFSPHGRVVIHADSDLYSSTLYCLTRLDPILVKGSILIFDEFYSSSNEFLAFYDYTRAYYREYRVLAAVGHDPYMQIAIAMA